MWEAMRLLIVNKGLTGRAAGALGVFVELIENLAAKCVEMPLQQHSQGDTYR